MTNLEIEKLKLALQVIKSQIDSIQDILYPPPRWGKWFEWDGSDKYGPSFDNRYEVTVQVQRRSPKSDHFMIAEAHHFDWTHNGSVDDIMFFREKLEGQVPYDGS